MGERAAGGRLRRIGAGLLLLAFSAFELRVFLGSGLPLFFDAHSHLARAWLAASALAADAWPAWSFTWYGGCRLFEFYAPGYYLLTGGVGLLVGSFALATKLVLFAGQAASVAAFYVLLLRLGAGPLAALFGGLLYLHDPVRWRLLAVIGNHPSLFVYLAAPLWMLAVLGADGTRRRNLRLFAASALLLSAMAAGHLTTSLYVLPALLAFACSALWQRSPRANARPALGALAASLVAFGAVTSALSVPMLRGLPLVSLSLESGGLGFDLEPLAIILGLRDGALRWIFAAPPGLLWCALALGAAVLSLRAAHARWRACAAGLLASLLAVTLLGDRATLALGFFVAPLCTAALEMASRALARRPGPRLALALQALAVAAVPVWQHTRDETPLRYVEPEALGLYARIPKPGDLGRTLDVTRVPDSIDGLYGQSSFAPYRTGRAVPFGGFPQGAPLAVNVQIALAGKLVQELGAARPTLSADALDLLQLLHVAWLVDRAAPPRLARLALEAGEVVRTEPGLLRLLHASPALFAARLDRLEGASPLAQLQERWASDPLEVRGQRSLDVLSRSGKAHDWPLFVPLLREMRIDRAGRRAERFFVERSLAGGEPASAAAAAEFSVLSHREELDRVEIVAQASAPGFVRLAYSFDPALGVALDGAAVESVPDFLGAVVLSFPAGTHAVTLRAPPATLQLRLLAASGAIAGTLVLVWVASFSIPSRATPTDPS